MPQPVNLPAAPPAYDVKWEQQVQSAVNAVGSARATDVVSAPAAGFTHQIPVNTGLCLLLPTGALATGTLTLPVTALDGFEQQILTSAAVTSLTVAASPGQTISGTAVFALAANVRACFRWLAQTATWYRMA